MARGAATRRMPDPAIILCVKHARPSLVQAARPRPKGKGWKHRTGGTSGLHRTAQEVTPLHREVRIRATETSRLSAGETGNLCAQQYQVGQPRGMWFAMSLDSVVRRNGWRVGSTEPSGRPSAQINGGHATGNRCAQNPAYRWASHFFCNGFYAVKVRIRSTCAINERIATGHKRGGTSS